MPRLENWRIVGNRLFGDVYDDEHGRFRDGTPVQTSTIMEIDEESGYARTRNTDYHLGEKYKEEAYNEKK